MKQATCWLNNNNEKTIAEDNKKHKRNLSSPATISISDYEGNVSTSGTERIIRTPRRSRGIFLSRRFKTSYKDRMAGAVSDDPSMSRMTNGMHVINGTPFFVNGTDSELEGYNRQSAMQLNHKNSISQIVESNDNEPDGKVKKKFQSSWDLTPKEIAKNEKRLKKKKGKQPRTSVILSKGLKELMNLADPLMTKEQTTLGEPTLKNLAEMKEESSENDDIKGLELDKEPLGLVNGGYHRSGSQVENVVIEEGNNNTEKSSSKKMKSSKFELPPPAKGKTLVDTVINTDIDTLFQLTFEDDSFFEVVSHKAIDEVKNFECPPWAQNEEGIIMRIQKYQFVKTVMMTRNVIKVQQTQTKTSTIPGKMYIVDAVTENSGIMYADYIRVPIQWRFIREDLFNGDRSVKENKRKTHVQITYEIEWVKACLMKGKVETETYNNLKKYYEVVEKELQSGPGDNKAVPMTRNRNLGDPQMTRRHVSRKNMPPEIPSAANTAPTQRIQDTPDEITIMRERFQYRENLLTCACILLLITMVFTTLAMYKLSSTISLLNERMSQIEQMSVSQQQHQDDFLKTIQEQAKSFNTS